MLELNRAYNIDCMKGMAQFPDNFFDLAVVDPPYGINAHDMSMGSNISRKENGYPAISTADRLKKSFDKRDWDWDCERPEPAYFSELIRVSKNQIIWGYNYFSDMLPPCRGVIVWDKVQPWKNFSQVEIAYTSFDRAATLFRYSNTGGNNAERKIHPTQKPIPLYAWIYSSYAKCGDKILDTHLGSGSSRIAAWESELKLQFIGFEIDREYYDLEEKRFQQVSSQMNLFHMT